jgi:hypothetical protein
LASSAEIERSGSDLSGIIAHDVKPDSHDPRSLRINYSTRLIRRGQNCSIWNRLGCIGARCDSREHQTTKQDSFVHEYSPLRQRTLGLAF